MKGTARHGPLARNAGQFVTDLVGSYPFSAAFPPGGVASDRQNSNLGAIRQDGQNGTLPELL